MRRLSGLLVEGARMDWFGALFTAGDGRYFVVASFPTAEEAERFGRDHHGVELAFVGVADQRSPNGLEDEIGRLAMIRASAKPTLGRWRGQVTRWRSGETWGFATDYEGRTWMLHQTQLPEGMDWVPYGTVVTFAGSQHPDPGQKHPRAYTIRLAEQDDTEGKADHE